MLHELKLKLSYFVSLFQLSDHLPEAMRIIIPSIRILIRSIELTRSYNVLYVCGVRLIKMHVV